jgi:hypothetical protein
LFESLKGQCHEMDIFLRSKRFIGTVCVCADGFQGLSKAYHYPVQLLTFYILILKVLTFFTKPEQALELHPLTKISLISKGAWPRIRY